MSMNNLKNMVVLKNLPSNLIDEAIVIFRDNKKAKKLEYIEKSARTELDGSVNTKDYMIKEAECVIANYISNIEEKKNSKKISNYNLKKKYKSLKKYSIVVSILLFVEIIVNFIG